MPRLIAQVSAAPKKGKVKMTNGLTSAQAKFFTWVFNILFIILMAVVGYQNFRVSKVEDNATLFKESTQKEFIRIETTVQKDFVRLERYKSDQDTTKEILSEIKADTRIIGEDVKKLLRGD